MIIDEYMIAFARKYRLRWLLKYTQVKCAVNVSDEICLKDFSATGGGGSEEQMIKEIMIYERILLQTIKFDLQCEHPYGYLLKYAKSLKGNREQIGIMVQMAWTFINDSYCTTLCLQWEPEIIAIALMYLTSKLSKLEITDWIDKATTTEQQQHQQNWWDQFVQDLGLDILEDICHQMLDLNATQQAQQQAQQQMQQQQQQQQQNTPTKQASGKTNVHFSYSHHIYDN